MQLGKNFERVKSLALKINYNYYMSSPKIAKYVWNQRIQMT